MDPENTTKMAENLTISQSASLIYRGCLPQRNLSSDYKYLYENSYENIWYISTWFHWLQEFGYVTSITCLIVALFIFSKYSQLQNKRVKMHMNLFVAMLLHTSIAFIHNLFYTCKVFYNVILDDDDQSDSVFCKALMTLKRYFELTKFTWLLIEGWYFYNLISQALHQDSNKIKPNLLMAWGLPLLAIVPWAMYHTLRSTDFCWVDDVKLKILAIPILIIVLTNMCFFILNVRILFIKMNSNCCLQRRKCFWRWLKSALMLVPLFGAYDIFYAIRPWIGGTETKIIFSFIIEALNASQGCIVTVLYCFTNSNVKTEIRRTWKNRKSRRELLKQKYHRKRDVSQAENNNKSMSTTVSTILDESVHL